MTDYLELLLEKQESEEMHQIPGWKRLKIPPINAAGQNGDLPGFGAVQLVEYAQDETRTAQEEQTLDERVPFENDPLHRRDLTVEILRLRRAVRQTAPRTNRSMEQGGGAFRGEPGFLGMSGRPHFKAVDYAALVDAAFARDARRYDGLPGLL